MSRAGGFIGIQVKPLYSQNIPELTGALLRQTNIEKDGQPTKIQIFEKGLKQFKNKKNPEICKWMEFQFDLIFNSIPRSQFIYFEKEYFETAYKFENSEEMQTVSTILKGKINQKGFHDSFEILYKLGKGSYGTVFAAKNRQTGVVHAMKSLNKQATYNEKNGKDSITKQIEILRTLKHNNTINLYEVFQTQTSLYLEFDLLEGGNLQQYFSENYKFSNVQIKQIIRGILFGLKQMHRLKIMHRDLKPENILFRQKNVFEPVIADFGLAQFVDTEKYLFVRCGSAGFVAPQVINSKDSSNRYDVSCDMFSLGLLFHILLYGKSIFPSKQYDELLIDNKTCKFDFNDFIYQNTDSTTLSFLKQLLQKNPCQRITAQKALLHDYFKAQQAQILQVIKRSDNIFEKQEEQTRVDSQQQEQSNTQEIKEPEIAKIHPRANNKPEESNYHAKFQRLQKSYFRSKQPNYLVSNNF